LVLGQSGRRAALYPQWTLGELDHPRSRIIRLFRTPVQRLVRTTGTPLGRDSLNTIPHPRQLQPDPDRLRFTHPGSIGDCLVVLPARAWNQGDSMAWGDYRPHTRAVRELRSARHTSPLKLVYWCLSESTEFRRIPRLPIRIKSEGKAANALANAYRYPPTVLRQVRGSRAAGPQPLLPIEEDERRRDPVLCWEHTSRLEKEARG